jgi:hypothetical protein
MITGAWMAASLESPPMHGSLADKASQVRSQTFTGKLGQTGALQAPLPRDYEQKRFASQPDLSRVHRRLECKPEDFRVREPRSCFPEEPQGNGVEVSRNLARIRPQILRHHVRADPLGKPETLQHSLITPPEKILKIEHERSHLAAADRGSLNLGRNVSCHNLNSNPFTAARGRRLPRTIRQPARHNFLRCVQLIFADKAFILTSCLPF